MTETAEKAFERDIQPNQRSEVLEMLACAAQGIDHQDVTILDRDRYDAINVKAHGIVELDGVEYRFIIEDGNWNGTELLDWEGDTKFEPYERTKWALQPNAGLVNEAIAAGREKFLVAKWDALLGKAEIREIPGKYAYDRMMQPGGLIENHYRERAAKYGFVIVSQCSADELRARLNEEEVDDG